MSPAEQARRWAEQLAGVRAFLLANDRLPHQREPGGKWLAKQRELARAGTLPPGRLEQLHTLPGFAVGQREARHIERLTELEVFVSLHGRVPVQNEPGYEQLAQWLRDHHRGRSHLPPDLADWLADIELDAGFTAPPEQSAFEDGLAHYLDYRQRVGLSWVQVSYVCPDGFPLGTWCLRRRQARNTMPAGRRATLDRVGFPWHATAQAPLAPAGSDTDPVLPTTRARTLSTHRRDPGP